MANTQTGILVVDDEESVRSILSHVLTEIGYRVRSAEDGFTALLEIHQEIPTILLTDLNMPDISGFELLSVVRRCFPSIQTVAMSGSFSGNEVPSGVAADAFYEKGSSLGALLQIIARLSQVEKRNAGHSSIKKPVLIQPTRQNSPGIFSNAVGSS